MVSKKNPKPPFFLLKHLALIFLLQEYFCKLILLTNCLRFSFTATVMFRFVTFYFSVQCAMATYIH